MPPWQDIRRLFHLYPHPISAGAIAENPSAIVVLYQGCLLFLFRSSLCLLLRFLLCYFLLRFLLCYFLLCYFLLCYFFLRYSFLRLLLCHVFHLLPCVLKNIQEEILILLYLIMQLMQEELFFFMMFFFASLFLRHIALSEFSNFFLRHARISHFSIGRFTCRNMPTRRNGLARNTSCGYHLGGELKIKSRSICNCGCC